MKTPDGRFRPKRLPLLVVRRLHPLVRLVIDRETSVIALRLARLITTNLGWGWRYRDGYLANNSEAFLNGQAARGSNWSSETPLTAHPSTADSSS